MLARCFGLGYRRVEWKCDSRNERSRRAALRTGFLLEGIQAQHMIGQGRSRDTAWFRILDHERPEVKRRLETMLYGSCKPRPGTAAVPAATRCQAPTQREPPAIVDRALSAGKMDAWNASQLRPWNRLRYTLVPDNLRRHWGRRRLCILDDGSGDSAIRRRLCYPATTSSSSTMRRPCWRGRGSTPWRLGWPTALPPSPAT